jgi:hypothetical protein
MALVLTRQTTVDRVPGMNEKYYQLIREQYKHRGADFVELFQTVLSIGREIGLDNALEYLEQCVIEKRLSWLDKNLEALERTGNPITDGYRIFYEIYLGISPPKDGEIAEQTDKKLVTRWWNDCPTLEACKKLGLDTREICKKVYHKPVQVFLSQIDPRLKFNRNYDVLRPHTPYCEEIIALTPVPLSSITRPIRS